VLWAGWEASWTLNRTGTDLSTNYSNKSRTLNFENRKNIARLALSPDSTVLISVDEGTLAL
jgi:hypothetical protein